MSTGPAQEPAREIFRNNPLSNQFEAVYKVAKHETVTYSTRDANLTNKFRRICSGQEKVTFADFESTVRCKSCWKCLVFIAQEPALANRTEFDHGPLIWTRHPVVRNGTPSLFDAGDQSAQGKDFPMCRDLAQPFGAGVLHGDVRVEALGNSPGDESGALLLEQLDQPLLLRQQPINPRRLSVEEDRDRFLIVRRGYYDPSLLDVFCVDVVVSPAVQRTDQAVAEGL
jgi:hypothetical protein